MRRFAILWLAFAAVVFAFLLALGAAADKLPSAWKFGHAGESARDMGFFLLSFQEWLVVPARWIYHPDNPGWLGLLAGVACCALWALPLAWAFQRLTRRSTGRAGI
jgi:hypothetical protein